MDAKFDADRRRVGERVAVSFRWLFLIVLAVLNNVTTVTGTEARGTVDILLAGWAVMNVAVNVLLARGYQPGKQFSLSTMSLDIFFATGLVYLSDGFSSPFFLALFLAVITNAVRRAPFHSWSRSSSSTTSASSRRSPKRGHRWSSPWRTRSTTAAH
jgi:hypothetical protein